MICMEGVCGLPEVPVGVGVKVRATGVVHEK